MVAVCTARTIARSIASSVCKKPLALSLASAAPTDIDQLLLDGTNAAHYTTAEWAGFEHLLKDQKTDIGTLRVPRGQRCYAPDGVDDYIAVASLTGSETVVSSSGTSTPSIAAGRINFTAGTVWDITLSNGSRYLCNEESGSTAYDIGDNAAHGTITNATLASFHSTSASVLTNRNNDVGYRLSGAVYIPKRLNAALAADGNALTHTGKCPQPGYAPQRCITPDGVNDYATAGNGIGNALGGSFTAICVSAWCYLASAGNGGVVFIGTFGTTGKVSLFTFGGSAYFRLNGSSDVNSSTGMSVGAWSHIAGTWDGTTQRLYVNGVQTASAAFSTAISATAIQTVLGTYAENFYNWPGRFCDVRIFSSNKTQAQIQVIMAGGTDTASLLAHWPCCEGPGSSNTNTTIYDVSGNGYNATITNATVANYWANSTTYDSRVVNYPLKYGYTVNGSGVVVPALLSGATDAAGNAIGQAAGGWASGLQNINCLPYTNPLGVSVGLETSLDPTADRKTTSSSKRRRRNTSGRYDRFGARATAMSDASSNAYFGD